MTTPLTPARAAADANAAVPSTTSTVTGAVVTSSGAPAEIGAPATDAKDVAAGPIANIPVRSDEFSQAYYSPAHLEQIRTLYRNGSPITLPAQLERERAELDAARESASLPTSSQPSNSSSSLNAAASAPPAGTAGPSSNAS